MLSCWSTRAVSTATIKNCMAKYCLQEEKIKATVKSHKVVPVQGAVRAR